MKKILLLANLIVFALLGCDEIVPLTLNVTVPTEKRNTSLELTVNLQSEFNISDVVWKHGTHNEGIIFDGRAYKATQTENNKVWTFTVSMNATYTVAAKDDGSRVSFFIFTVDCFEYTAPANVSNLESTYDETTPKMTVTWNNPTDEDFEGLKISWKKDNGDYGDPISLSKDTTTYTIESIDESASSYTICIKTYDTLGNESGGVTKYVLLSAPASINPEGFVKIDGSKFFMGSTSSNAYQNEKNVHDVILNTFLICDHEVTQKEYETYCKYSSLGGPIDSLGKGENYPAYNVSWYDAVVYCNLRSKGEDLTPCYSLIGETDVTKWNGIQGDSTGGYFGPSYTNSDWNKITCNWTANGYRLPTEAEWEYAARGGIVDTNKDVWAGTTIDTDLGKYGWYNLNGEDKKTHEVKKKKQNDYRLYDMSGNVGEWCWDWFKGNYSVEEQTNPTGSTSGEYRIFRGGKYDYPARDCRVSFRFYAYPFERNNGIGFRLVRTVQ